MIGCPTGAIHRKPTGEVAIHDFCIGCSNCAIRCPWDNITMVPTPGRFVGDLATPKIASKCDLCFGYDGANCVHNCPTQAIIRIDPVAYFPEVQMALGASDRKAFASTERAKQTDLTRPVIWGVTFLLAAAMIMVSLRATPYHPATPIGTVFGGSALLLMLLATALGARRRMARWPKKAPHPDHTGTEAPRSWGRSMDGRARTWPSERWRSSRWGCIRAWRWAGSSPRCWCSCSCSRC
jgi:ferredoxin